MTDSSFERWRAAQRVVRDIEHRIAMASHSSTAHFVQADAEALRQDLQRALREADEALEQCLREIGRPKRSTDNLGLSTSGSSQ